MNEERLTVEALKNVYAALGGDRTDVANLNVIPDVINAIADYIRTNN